MSNPFMDMLIPPMFNINCLVCGEKFNIHFKYILQKQTIICPCCGQIMDEKAFCLLQNSIASLDEFLKEQSKHNVANENNDVLDSKYDMGFLFSIDWKNKLPGDDKPSFS